MEKLSELANELAVAIANENSAKARRIHLEEEIAQLIETPENGSKTVQANDALKVTVKRALGYTADVNAIRDLDIPEMPLKLKPETWEFDSKKYESILTSNPSAAKLLARHVTVKPRKVSVTIKVK